MFLPLKHALALRPIFVFLRTKGNLHTHAGAKEILFYLFICLYLQQKLNAFYVIAYYANFPIDEDTIDLWPANWDKEHFFSIWLGSNMMIVGTSLSQHQINLYPTRLFVVYFVYYTIKMFVYWIDGLDWARLATPTLILDPFSIVDFLFFVFLHFSKFRNIILHSWAVISFFMQYFKCVWITTTLLWMDRLPHMSIYVRVRWQTNSTSTRW